MMKKGLLRLPPVLLAATLLLLLCACGPKESMDVPAPTPSASVTPTAVITPTYPPLDTSGLPDIPLAADSATYNAESGVYWNGSWGVVLPENVRDRIIIRDGFFYDKTVYAYCQAYFPELSSTGYSLFAIWEDSVNFVGSMGSASPVPACQGPDGAVTLDGKCYVYGNGFYENDLPHEGLYPYYNETLDDWKTPMAILDTFFINDPRQPMEAEFSFTVAGARLCLGTTLSGPLGEPLNSQRGTFAFTGEDTLVTDTYDGLVLERNSGYLLSAEITGTDMVLWRGVEIGATRAQVEEAYPDAEVWDDGTVYYQPQPMGSRLTFLFDSDSLLTQIDLRVTFA